MIPETIQVKEFIKLYDQRQIRRNTGGLQEASFFLWQFLVNRNDVKHVVESGVWRGQTTWLISRTRPDVIIDCLDPITCCFSPDARPDDSHVLAKCAMPGDMSRNVIADNALWWACDMQPPQIQKAPHDILTFDPRHPKSGTTMVVLDDHQDILPRLERCVELGVTDVFIDDEHPWYGDHKTLWCYRNHRDPLVAGKVSENEACRFLKFEVCHIAECCVFPHLEHSYFKQFEPHQYFTYVKLK